MRRWLLALPVLFLTACLGLGGVYFVLSTDDAPGPTIVAADIDLDGGEPRPVAPANAPLESIGPRAPKPAPEAKPEPKPIAAPETPEPAPADNPLDKLSPDMLKEIEKRLAEEGKDLKVEELVKLAEQLQAQLDKLQITFKGRVLDHAGNGLAGASVLLKAVVVADKNSQSKRRPANTARAIATTDAEGNFEGKYSPPSQDAAAFDVELHAFAPQALTSEVQKLNVTPGQSYAGLTFNMPEGAGISGRVVDQNFNPIMGASVTASVSGTRDYVGGARPRAVHTDADGRFSISGLQPGSYTISVNAKGYTPQGTWQSVEAPAGQPTMLAADIVMNMQTGFKVKLTCAERQPTGSFVVTFWSGETKLRAASSTADAEGLALIANVPEGTTEIAITMRGYKITAEIAVSPLTGSHVDIGEVALVVAPEEPKKTYPNRGSNDGDSEKSGKLLGGSSGG